jgi:hypothetical protein
VISLLTFEDRELTEKVKQQLRRRREKFPAKERKSRDGEKPGFSTRKIPCLRSTNLLK